MSQKVKHKKDKSALNAENFCCMDKKLRLAMIHNYGEEASNNLYDFTSNTW